MKLFQIALLISTFLSCRENFRYSIKKEEKILLDDSSCKIVSYYPVIGFKNNDSVMNELNKNLSVINSLERYVVDCSTFFSPEYSKEKKEIIGDYKILFETDTLLNMEFVVQSKYLSKKEYRSVFIDLIKGQLIEGHQVIPNIDRSKLYPYVKKFSDSTGIYINLKAYEKESNYSIMFGKTKNDFVLYLGKEGEFGGYYKLSIPWKEISN